MAEFEEIGHTGGKVTFTVETDEKGNRRYQIGISHAAPRPASFFAIYALPPHLPVATLPLGGIGSSMPPPPIEGAFPVFVASDSEGWFGHQCPRCRGYASRPVLDGVDGALPEDRSAELGFYYKMSWVTEIVLDGIRGPDGGFLPSSGNG